MFAFFISLHYQFSFYSFFTRVFLLFNFILSDLYWRQWPNWNLYSIVITTKICPNKSNFANLNTIFIAHLFSDSEGHININSSVEQCSLSLDKTLEVSVDKDLYRVPDDGPEEKSQEDEEAAPPQSSLPGLVAQVPEGRENGALSLVQD